MKEGYGSEGRKSGGARESRAPRPPRARCMTERGGRQATQVKQIDLGAGQSGKTQRPEKPRGNARGAGATGASAGVRRQDCDEARKMKGRERGAGSREAQKTGEAGEERVVGRGSGVRRIVRLLGNN